MLSQQTRQLLTGMVQTSLTFQQGEVERFKTLPMVRGREIAQTIAQDHLDALETALEELTQEEG